MKRINVEKMKSIGAIRAIDRMGRISISAEARSIMGIGADDLLEQKLCKDENGDYVIVIRKWEE